ncbi:bromodomain-containing protein 8-like [Oppia nitens]|uniref:bromodomain-containing protein 8-like n=1 Tax=Oppia nitens TaxID=1686743 RepID=UPI0023D9CAC9|nr:bromodomain-containing protein 8-like [Oppia nitens]
MTTTSANSLKSRLRVVPIDEWSTREKLCLASSVLKSGDQNWSSVSRPLKAFSEPNRPNDWFHQKYCAIQYQDLLEKIETETPKRKRSERGEETPQTIIVRNLTKQRIEELRQITAMERDLILKVKQDLELLKNKKMSDKRIEELRIEIKEKETKEKEKEIEHKKWLEERSLKISQMTRKGTFATRHKPVAVNTPIAADLQSPPITGENSGTKSPVNEPLKVEIESNDSSNSQTVTSNQIIEKTTNITPSPSTSPLLTSLLQSPTPSTQSILSPTKSGQSGKQITRQISSTHLSSIIRQPTTSDVTNEKISESPVKKTTIQPSKEKIFDKIDSKEQTPCIGFSKLSKLLESTNTSKSKQSDTEVNKESNDTSDQLNVSTTEDKRSKVKGKDKKDSENTEEVVKKDESNERSLRSRDKNDEQKVEKHLSEKSEDKEVDQNTDKKDEENVEIVSIKQEIIDINVDEESPNKESDKLIVKTEPTDTSNAITSDDSKTPLNRSKRLRKPAVVVTTTTTTTTTNTNTTAASTPQSGRRWSRRVAQKDAKLANDDSTEMSDQSVANTPQAIKKRGSIDDTTETSMSEESMDAKLTTTSVASETVPNSPASVKTEDIKESDSKEYKTWKKAVMVNWRLISSHKYASLFSHPVTESEAKGYEEIVKKPIDLNSIKKRIESGVIRTTIEYQRDILIMFQNALMFNNASNAVHKWTVDMQKDTIASIEDFIANFDNRKPDNINSESKLRGRERRSNVSTMISPIVTDSDLSVRRKSRCASTDTDSNASSLNKSVTKKRKI